MKMSNQRRRGDATCGGDQGELRGVGSMSWPTTRFEQLYAEPSRNGVYKQAQFHGTGVRIVNMGELFSYDIISNQRMNRLAMNEAEMVKSGIQDGDLLFGRRSLVEAGAGKCSLVEGLSEPTTFESSIIRVRVDEKRLRPRFIYYWLKSHSGRGAIRAIVTGTNVKGIKSSVLKDIEVPCPTTETQDRVVELLRAYDDLIENNRRRIQLLEQAARLLYREWFVRLRFPGHEHVKIKDGVPEGWDRKKIADVCETVGGGTPSTKVPDYWDGDITWIVPTDVTNNDCLVLLDSERKITEKGLRESSAKMVPAESILMTSRASVGYFALVDFEVCTNQGFINIIPHQEELRMYLLFNLMSRVSEIRGNSKGSTYPEISKGRFREMDIVIPQKTIVDEFGEFAIDIIRQMRCLKRSTLKLEKARDLLLPRLMNGVIPV
jgi:type I restriction enzyme, S subunit